MPPLLAFNRGTVGFLTPFDPQQYRETLSSVIRGGMAVHARRRLDVQVRTGGECYGTQRNAAHCSRAHMPVAECVNHDVLVWPNRSNGCE